MRNKSILEKPVGGTSADVADAIAKKHTQGTDTTLGVVGTKNPPIDADKAIYRDSTAGDTLVTSTWTQIKAFLKTYFDGLYAAVLGANDNYVTDTEKSALHAVGDSIAASISDGDLTHSPDGNSVFDALALKAPLSSPALTGTPTAPTAGAGISTTQLATTEFVQVAVRSSPGKEACEYATIAALPTVVYNNGTAGVGATLTGVALGALGVDSQSPAVGNRILVKNQADNKQNGIYTVTATGSGIAVFVMTRALDFNQQTDVLTGAATYIVGGTTLVGTTWDVNSTDSPVMGTDAITFVQSAGPGSVVAGNGIAIAGTSIAINTTVVPVKTDNLSVFGATTSAQLKAVISDETGSGALVFETALDTYMNQPKTMARSLFR